MNRRVFLRGLTVGSPAGVVGMVAGCLGDSGDGSASENNASNTYKLGGEVAGWRGQAPASISGKTNPTLVLKPGQKYTVIWENLDGAPHNFTINDANGKPLKQTDTTSKTGKTLSLTFTASKKMAQYICTLHPSTMKGEIRQRPADSNGGMQRKQVRL